MSDLTILFEIDNTVLCLEKDFLNCIKKYKNVKEDIFQNINVGRPLKNLNNPSLVLGNCLTSINDEEKFIDKYEMVKYLNFINITECKKSAFDFIKNYICRLERKLIENDLNKFIKEKEHLIDCKERILVNLFDNRKKILFMDKLIHISCNEIKELDKFVYLINSKFT